jgi:hypothetical protein
MLTDMLELEKRLIQACWVVPKTLENESGWASEGSFLSLT